MFGPSSVPAFRPHVTAQRLPSGALVVLTGTQRFLFPAGPLANLAMLLDGRRTVNEVIGAAEATMSAAEAVYGLETLLESRYVEMACPEQDAARRAFLGALDLPDDHGGGEAGRAVSVSSTGGTPAAWSAWLAGALRELGGKEGRDGPPLEVVVVPDLCAPELEAYDAEARVRGAEWIPVKPSGTRGLVGPLLAAKGPCWQCLAFALRRNRPVERMLEREGSPWIGAPEGSVGASVHAILGLAALAIAKHVAGATDARLDDRLVEVRLDSFEMVSHRVVRRPQCPACGDPGIVSRQGETPVRLRPIPKAAVSDGGFRARSARQTYEAYRHLVSPLTGPVTHLVPMPGRYAEGRPVYAAGYLVCPRDAATVQRNVFDRYCAGKGVSDEQGRASALCEALERASSVYEGDEARVRGKARDLGEGVVHPDALQRFSERQFGRRDELNATVDDVRVRIPVAFHPDAVIDWTPAWSLTHDARRHVPLSYCYSEAPDESGARYAAHNPNGTAAGNCLEEAILQGLLELVERDAAAIWWYNRLRRPAVDLPAFRSRFFDGVADQYRREGWSLSVLDLTHDLGPYVFAAVAAGPSPRQLAIGLGCHLDGRLAIQRALAELNQLRGPGEEGSTRLDLDALPSRAFLAPDPSERLAGPECFPGLGQADLGADVASCVDRLARRGLDVIVVDKTRPDFGIPVAQVLVPGLRHFWPRFGPGRLFTVPVELGWSQATASEDDLNPVAFLL